MLTKKQFDVLTVILSHDQPLTQRALAEQAEVSLGTANKLVTQLTEMGCIADHRVTEQGRQALEPYRVKRAVFLAAGFGSRLVPVTLNTPKPLVRVGGIRIIDTLLDAVQAAGIEEIVVVRGYLKEQFDQLLYKYPNIRFIDNPDYNEANNISSAVCARELFGNAYVFEADLLLYNPALITPYQYMSNYLGVPVDMTNDWCFTVENGLIKRVSIGGTDCHHMFGISYWTAEDGARLADHLLEAYQAPGGRERYWDQVALDIYRSEYNIAVRSCTFEDIVEIDTYRELKQLDPLYT